MCWGADIADESFLFYRLPSLWASKRFYHIVILNDRNHFAHSRKCWSCLFELHKQNKLHQTVMQDRTKSLSLWSIITYDTACLIPSFTSTLKMKLHNGSHPTYSIGRGRRSILAHDQYGRRETLFAACVMSVRGAGSVWGSKHCASDWQGWRLDLLTPSSSLSLSRRPLSVHATLQFYIPISTFSFHFCLPLTPGTHRLTSFSFLLLTLTCFPPPFLWRGEANAFVYILPLPQIETITVESNASGGREAAWLILVLHSFRLHYRSMVEGLSIWLAMV